MTPHATLTFGVTAMPRIAEVFGLTCTNARSNNAQVLGFDVLQ